MRSHKMFVIMSLSALLISGSYKVYALDNTQIYKCISQNGQIAYQDYVCRKGSSVEKMAITAQNRNNITSLRTHEVAALEKMHQRLHHERELNNQRKIASDKNKHATLPQNQVTQIHLQHNVNHTSVDQHLNQNVLTIKK